MSYLFYDLETSGLQSCWDVPLQAAFMQCDLDLSVQRELTLRCRLPQHIVPSPEALMITGVTPAMLEDQGRERPATSTEERARAGNRGWPTERGALREDRQARTPS